MRRVFAFGLLLSLAFPTHSAFAFAGTNPNVIRALDLRGFNRRVDANAKYRYKKRRIQAQDQFTTASGSLSTFDRRADYLRDAQKRRIQEDLNARMHTINENRATGNPRQDRAVNTILRRIGNANVRLRGGTQSLRQMRGLSSQEKLDQVRQYRNTLQEAESSRFNFTTTDCTLVTGRRRARCLYELRSN